MKIHPKSKHRQAIQYTEINMNKLKVYFYNKDDIEEIRRMNKTKNLLANLKTLK